MSPDPSLGNLATASCPFSRTSCARQNSRRPTFFFCVKLDRTGNRVGSGHTPPASRVRTGRTYIRKQTNTATGLPGRPRTTQSPICPKLIGLPGNPVAVFVCFLMYVRPVLTRLAGGVWPEPTRFPVLSNFTQKKKVGRREFWRAQLVRENGQLAVAKFPRDGSGLISSLREADGLIEVSENIDEVRAGELVEFIPFSEFGLDQR